MAPSSEHGRSMPHDAIATIGYEAVVLEDLVATLRDAGIETLIDVRAAPVSKRPEFAKDALAAALEAARIGYLHLGHLGSPRAARKAARAGDTAAFEILLESHLDGPAARRALDRAAALVRDGSVCLMCLERDPERCHRRFVAARLAAMTERPIRHLRVTRDPGPLFAARQRAGPDGR
jgi:uncharacterized protein (DUF488 family)